MRENAVSSPRSTEVIEMPRTTTLSKADLVSLCLLIGCSGMSPKICPGDPDCEILHKMVGREEVS